MPDTLRLSLALPDDGARETAIADLADLGFDAFEEDGDALVAYAPAARWDDVEREAVAALLRARGLGTAAMHEEVVRDQDWNARWESGLRPVAAGPFVVAPTWTEVGPEHAGRTVLRIDPKMAFGTGYHESTRLVLRLLSEVVPSGGRVLDVGSGTGVLAIGALALGARSALGVDIDPWSVTNGTENAAANDVKDRFEVREGSLEVVGEEGFDLVLANIIRSVLIPMLPDLVRLRSPGAPVVLAGLLASERDVVIESARSTGLALVNETTENEWWACVLR